MQNAKRDPVAKALKALSVLIEAEGQDMGVRDMAAALGVSPSSAHRLLNALVEEGFARQNAQTTRYALGLEFLRLAHLSLGRAPLRRAALPLLRRLVDACNETALLGLYDSSRQQMMFATSIESTHPLRYAVEVNTWLPVHAGASGLAILASLPQDEIARVIERTRLAPLTAQTITEPYRLEAELERIRQRGYAITRGQRIPGAVGLAAPIFGHGEDVLGDVCLTIPEQRFDAGAESRIASLLLTCTDGITTAIGGRKRQREANLAA